MFSFMILLIIFGVFAFIVIPKYLEFRKVLGLDKLWRETGPLSSRVAGFLVGLKTQILGLSTLIAIAVSYFLEGAGKLDLEAVMSHDKARFVAFWLGLATLISHVFAMCFAARAKPVETKDSDS